MFHHVRTLPEGFVAYLALERTHVGVDLLVDRQEAACPERLPTHGALERFLTCVSALVIVQQTLVWKALTTLVAHVRIPVFSSLWRCLGLTCSIFIGRGLFWEDSLVLAIACTST